MIVISGDLNWHTVERLHDTVAAIGTGSKVLIDVTNLTTIDSAGTSALISTYLRESRAGRQVAMVVTSSNAAVLQEVGISQVVPIFASRLSAYEWLAVP